MLPSLAMLIPGGFSYASALLGSIRGHWLGHVLIYVVLSKLALIGYGAVAGRINGRKETFHFYAI